MLLVYYILLFPISKLPWKLLYAFSDFLYWLVYKVLRYRVKVVNQNLRNSFPEKSEREIKEVRRKFYRHFCDITLETIRMQNMKAEEILKRQTVANPEIVDHIYEQGRGLIVCTAHYNNWEYVATGINPWFKHQTLGIYHQFKSKFFERKMLEARSVTGMLLISRKAVKEGYFDEHDDPYAIFFGVDQSPTTAKKVYWTNFLNQETSVAFGAEKYAKERNAPVVFAKNEKVKRGHYRMTLEILTEEPLATKHGEITEMHTKTLEKIILEKPEYWLWTHKRWKRKRKEGE